MANWTAGHLFHYVLIATFVNWLVLFLLLRIEGEGFASIGLTVQKLRTGLGPGVLFGLGIFALDVFLLTPFFRWCLPRAGQPSLNHWFQGPLAVPLWLFLGSVSGPNEESSRTFILTRFEKLWPAKGITVGLVLQAVMFGVNHVFAGPVGAFSAGIHGLIFGLIYLRRRSCWEAAVTHSSFNLIGAGLTIFTLH
jgi:membrane protease YdiL (CAAX protease family)